MTMIRYSILIHWSDEDNAFIASLPEFGPCCKTHGSTHEEALSNAQEALALLLELHEQDGKPLPKPQTFSMTTMQLA
jgi:antitoxin HicB